MHNITITGLGYVGLPLACLCSEKGNNVYGLDVDERRIKLINQGISPINDEFLNATIKNLKGKITATLNPDECIPSSDIVIVCVPTPVDENHIPDLSALKKAIESISSAIKKGTVLVVESTIYPGTIEEIVIPILEKKMVDVLKNEVYVAHCPERIDPGNKKWTIDTIPRVVGGAKIG